MNSPGATYRCPGETYEISRAVHLGRLGNFYPACRQCPHRDDTGSHSPLRVQQLVETRFRGEPHALFYSEGLSGECHNQLDATTARRAAAAFGLYLRQETGQAGDAPVLIAADGRPLTAELVPAIDAGLRWSGYPTVDIGRATAACLTTAVEHLAAAGGVYIGNPSSRPHHAGIKFWRAGARPLSAGGQLDEVRAIFARHADRATRCYPAAGRLQADELYLSRLEPYFHALRPLRVALDTSCEPLVRYLERLIRNVGCKFIPTSGRLEACVLAERAHFGMWIDGDGECCSLLDEAGRLVPPEQLLRSLSSYLLAEHPAAVVVEDGTSEAACWIAEVGGEVNWGGSTRETMDAALRQTPAVLGGGASGRFWFGPGRADALQLLAILLTMLSQSDRPLSDF